MNLRQVYEELQRQRAEVGARVPCSPFALERAGLRAGLEEAITLLRPLVEAMPEVGIPFEGDDTIFSVSGYHFHLQDATPAELRAIADKMEEGK